MSHASEVAARAAKNITEGEYKDIYWWGAIFCGHFLPFFLLSSPFSWAPFLAVPFILGGLYCYEHVFVMAPQKIPNS